MKIEGTFQVDAPQDLVWTQVRDPQVMVQCIPGCDSIEQIDPMAYRALVSVKVGPITARFNLVVTVLSEDAPHSVISRTSGEEGTRASVVSSDNVLRLAPLPGGGTEISYAADVSMTGRLGKFGLGIFRKKADQLAEVFIDNFRQRLQVAA